MRPVNRGPWPEKEGMQIVFTEYGYARPYLIERLGDYCSFCEIALPNPAVEHVRHKDNNPALECVWTNFLLACPSCNSTKGTRVDTAEDVQKYLWPDQDRSFVAFTYEADGIVRVADTKDPAFKARAIATMNLVGLDKRPKHGLTTDQLLRGSDRRWEKRLAAWSEAREAYEDLQKDDHPDTRKWIVKSALKGGFWSVWMTVFADKPLMIQDFCNAFTGTALERV